MTSSMQPTAAILVIGDEILSGRTQEGNAGWLAGRLTEHGVALREIRVVPDDHETIVEAVRTLSDRYDHLFTSGGIGPTHDDITADAVAAAFGAHLDVRDDARAILAAHYADGELNEARLRMARIPDGARLIDNPVSRAPGFSLGGVHVMAGVPAIFQAMANGLLPQLAGGPPLLSRSFRALAVEGDLADGLRTIDCDHPAVSIGVYPFHKGGLGSVVVVRSTDEAALAAAAEPVLDLMRRFAKDGEVQVVQSS